MRGVIICLCLLLILVVGIYINHKYVYSVHDEITELLSKIEYQENEEKLKTVNEMQMLWHTKSKLLRFSVSYVDIGKVQTSLDSLYISILYNNETQEAISIKNLERAINDIVRFEAISLGNIL